MSDRPVPDAPPVGTMPRCRTCLHWAAYGTGRGECALSHEGLSSSLHTARVLIAGSLFGPYHAVECGKVAPALYAVGSLETDGEFGCVSHEAGEG